MDYRATFNKTLREFGITAKSLSMKAGVQERQVSLFRNGKDLMASTFFDLVSAMPPEAQQYFFESLLGESLRTPSSDLERVVEGATSVELGHLLKAIGSKMSASSSSERAADVPQEALL
jgi:hypothetical protein